MKWLVYHEVKGCGPLPIRDTWYINMVRCARDGTGVLLSRLGWGMFVRLEWKTLTWELEGHSSPQRSGRASTEEELLRAGIAALEEAEDFYMLQRNRAKDKRNAELQVPAPVDDSQHLSASEVVCDEAEQDVATKAPKKATKRKPRAKSSTPVTELA